MVYYNGCSYKFLINIILYRVTVIVAIGKIRCWRTKPRAYVSGCLCEPSRYFFVCISYVFFFFSYFLSPGLPSAPGQISWFRPNYGCARSLTDERLHYNMLYNNISTRVHAYYIPLYSVLCVLRWYTRRPSVSYHKPNARAPSGRRRQIKRRGWTVELSPATNSPRGRVCIYRPRRDIINLIRRVYITQANRAWR